ncbi:MAG TPA: CvpA family protein [Tepidisphaeraceae bacterium]|jgi:hypothetical protein|nr:CvpA family protein [Tepidisphaeraceae bacterium]
MVFTIFLGVLFLGVVFFHYVQGFFSATLSAILAIIAAVLAFSWHETIVEALLKGKAANIAHASVLVVLFAAIYLVLRIIFDRAVPEGVTLPAIVDRIGGAVMGLVAATFAIGTFAIAAQELPFGASVVGYTKYDAADVDAQLQQGGGGQMQRGFNYNELHSDLAGKFDEGDRRQTFPVILPGIDEIVVDTVYHLSSTGSLQGSQPLSDLHPDFLQELFGQRIGIQPGAKHVDLNLGKEKAFDIAGAYTLPLYAATTPASSKKAEARLVDSEAPGVRQGAGVKAPLKIVDDYTVITGQKAKNSFTTEKIKTVIPSNPRQVLLVIRILFGPDASDMHDVVRISPGSIRLARGRFGDSDAPEPQDFYPIGTLEPGNPYPLLYIDKLDDYLIVPMATEPGFHPGMDAVFAVDADTFLTKDKKLKKGTYIEIKRMFREDLSGKAVTVWSAPVGSGGNPPDIKLATLHQARGINQKIHADTTSFPLEAPGAAPK